MCIIIWARDLFGIRSDNFIGLMKKVTLKQSLEGGEPVLGYLRALPGRSSRLGGGRGGDLCWRILNPGLLEPKNPSPFV